MTVSRTYLDMNATVPLRPEARTAMLAALDLAGNPSSVHAEGRAARAVVERAREQVAALVNARPGEVVFTSGATEANTMALRGGTFAAVLAGAMEHASVLLPARQFGPACTELPAAPDGQYDLNAATAWFEAAPAVPGPRRLATIGLANGETGVLQPVGALAELAAAAGVLVHTDAAQAAGRIPVDFKSLGVGLMSVSAHKLGGPKGVGALIVRDGVALEPLLVGGGQERRRRAGTENVAGLAGFGAAAEAAQRDLADAANVQALRDELEAALKAAAPDCIILGSDARRLPNTTLAAMPGKPAETLVIKLDLAGFAVSAGAACSSGKVGESHVLKAMGVPADIARGAVRVSIGPATTRDDIGRFAAAWAEASGRPALAA